MERRLLKAIATPAMIVTWVTGLWLASILNAWSQGWFHLKLTAVVGMTVMHMVMARWVRLFANDENPHSGKFFRMMNEVPTVLMIGAVVAVIVKPF